MYIDFIPSLAHTHGHRLEISILVIASFCDTELALRLVLSETVKVEIIVDILKKVYDNVIVSILVMVGSLTKSGSMKKNTGMSTVSPALSLCSSKQKHCILLK